MATVDKPLEQVILSLADAYFPSLTREAEEARSRGDASLAKYYEFGGSQLPGLPEKVIAFVPDDTSLTESGLRPTFSLNIRFPTMLFRWVLRIA